jgi:sugar phosphate isomerase/epimerase
MGRIGLQLYSVLGFKPEETPKIAEKLAAMGYEGIEFLKYNTLPVKELRKKLDSLGMVSSGTHISYESLINELDDVLRYCNEIGESYIVLPRLPEPMRNAGGCKKAFESLSPAAERIRQNGLKLVFHHHEWEVLPGTDGKTAMDIMAEILPVELLAFQAEIYCLESAGVDPLGFIKKYKDRCVSVHISDKKSKQDPAYTELGRGIIALEPIVNLCEEIGIDWYNVEQETYDGGIFASLKENCAYLKKLLKK